MPSTGVVARAWQVPPVRRRSSLLFPTHSGSIGVGGGVYPRCAKAGSADHGRQRVLCYLCSPVLTDTARSALSLMVFCAYLGWIPEAPIRYRASMVGLLFFLGGLCRESFVVHIALPVALTVDNEDSGFTPCPDR